MSNTARIVNDNRPKGEGKYQGAHLSIENAIVMKRDGYGANPRYMMQPMQWKQQTLLHLKYNKRIKGKNWAYSKSNCRGCGVAPRYTEQQTHLYLKYNKGNKRKNSSQPQPQPQP